jgi:hypothetical protein
MIRFFAYFLFILAAWTLVIKYAFPVAYALAEGEAVDSYIYWDFWWVVHIWLGWSLLNWRRHTFELAIAICVVEIVIIVTKFVNFLYAPQWSIWQTNWFINKIFVLACFVLLLVYLLLNTKRFYRPAAVYTPDSS